MATLEREHNGTDIRGDISGTTRTRIHRPDIPPATGHLQRPDTHPDTDTHPIQSSHPYNVRCTSMYSGVERLSPVGGLMSTAVTPFGLSLSARRSATRRSTSSTSQPTGAHPSRSDRSPDRTGLKSNLHHSSTTDCAIAAPE